MPTPEDPLGWGDIAAGLARKAWYDAADAANGWPSGTAAANNGEPGIAGSPVVAPNTGTSTVPGVTGVTPAAPAAPPADTSHDDDADVFKVLAKTMDDAGIGGLYTVGADGTPSGWLWDQIVSGATDDPAIFQANLEQTPQWQAEYQPIVQLRAQAKANPGSSTYIPSMEDVRNYRKNVTTMLKRAGLPSTFYDQDSDLDQLMIAGLDPTEIETRIGTAWSNVQSTDPAVRAAFSEFYGVGQGDSALAAWFLDPTHTEAQLEKASRAAYTAGQGRAMGINVDQAMAEKIAMLPKTEGGIVQDLQQVNQLAGVFNEGITETQDLSAEQTGLSAVALGDAQANADIERRVLQRQANARATVGGALSTNAGMTGVGSS